MWTNRTLPEATPRTLNTVTAPESLRFYETSAETRVAMNDPTSQTLSEQQSPDLLGRWGPAGYRYFRRGDRWAGSDSVSICRRDLCVSRRPSSSPSFTRTDRLRDDADGTLHSLPGPSVSCSILTVRRKAESGQKRARDLSVQTASVLSETRGPG